MNIEKLEKLGKALLKEVNEFLYNNGGLGNGYDTWVEGEVPSRAGLQWKMKWHTPEHRGTKNSFENLRIKDVYQKGEELADKLGNIVLSSKLDAGISIKVKKKHIEDGCYRLSIEFLDFYEVPL